jgi:hypothetical protein
MIMVIYAIVERIEYEADTIIGYFQQQSGAERALAEHLEMLGSLAGHSEWLIETIEVA